MSKYQSPICEVCSAWMLEKDGWLKCVSCGLQKKVIKRIIKPIGKDVMENQMSMSQDSMHTEVL